MLMFPRIFITAVMKCLFFTNTTTKCKGPFAQKKNRAANLAWHPHTACPPSRGGTSHMRMPRIMVETSGAPVVQHIQIVPAVSIAALAPCGFPASAALSPVQAMYAVRGSVVENIPTVVVLHTLLSLRAALTPSCVGLGWSCPVASGEGIITCTVVRCHSSVFFSLPAALYCSTVASLCAPVSDTSSICEGFGLRHAILQWIYFMERHARFVR